MTQGWSSPNYKPVNLVPAADERLRKKYTFLLLITYITEYIYEQYKLS
jgi:hypothetical protein